MKNYRLTDILYLLFNIIVLLLGLRLYSIFSVFEISVTLVILGILLLFYASTSRKLSKILCFVLVTLLIIYFVTQRIFSRAFFTFYRLSYAFSMITTLVHFTDSAVGFIAKRDYAIVALVILGFVISYFINIKKEITVKWYVIALVGLLLIGSGIGMYKKQLKFIKDMDNTYSTNFSEYYIYNTVPNDQLFVDKFGLMTYMVRDIAELFENNISEETKYEISEYLMARGDREENIMTGVFEGKSVLVVQAESLTDIAIDSELTPILWKMKYEGIFALGFNTPLLPGSTSDTEFMANLSLIPDSSVGCSNNEYPYNTYKATLPKMFADKGYVPVAFHNLWRTMYNRDEMFSQIGYSSYYDNHSVYDTEEAQEIIEFISNSDDKNMIFWITYSGHGPYNRGEASYYSEEDYNKVKTLYPNLNDENAIYLAKNMDLDHALENIITALDEKDSLSDWVFVIYGDHSGKGIDYSEEGNLYSNLETGILSKNTDLIIYNSETERYVLDKIGTSLDILPTLANMFSLDYDYNAILGHDLFDSRYNGLYFSNYDYWATSDYHLDIYNNELYLNDNSTKTYEEAREEAENYRKMPDISQLILKSDYFKNND